MAPSESTDGLSRGDGRDELVALARGSGLNLVGAVFSQVSLLATSIVLAHWLGAGDLGVYWQSYAVLSLLGLVALAGFGTAVTRFVAVHRAEGDDAALRGTIRFALGLTVVVAMALAAALHAAAPWLAHDVFGDERLQTALRFVALTIPAMALMDVCLAATKGFRSMKAFALIGLAFEPGLRVAVTIVVVVLGAGLAGAMAALTVSNVVAAVLAAVALKRMLGPVRVPPTYRPREILSFSVVSWIASLATTGLIWADTLLLGIYLPSAEVGVYNVATRVVVLASFVMLPINASFAPRVADLHHRGQTDALGRTYSYATTWIVRLSLPAFVVLVLFARDILSFFGPAFPAAAAVTIVLVVGKAVDAATGPCAMMLNMSGRPALNMVDNITALALNVGLNLWLIPRYGIVGAAVAWAVALGVVNAARVVQVRATMGMWPFSSGTATALAASAAGAAAGFLVRNVAAGLSAMVVGALAVVATYVALLALVGVTADDRTLLKGLRAGGARS